MRSTIVAAISSRSTSTVPPGGVIKNAFSESDGACGSRFALGINVTIAMIEPPSIVTIHVRHRAGVRVRCITSRVIRVHHWRQGSLSSCFSKNDAATGRTVIAMKNDAETATAIVNARS